MTGNFKSDVTREFECLIQDFNIISLEANVLTLTSFFLILKQKKTTSNGSKFEFIYFTDSFKSRINTIKTLHFSITVTLT